MTNPEAFDKNRVLSLLPFDKFFEFSYAFISVSANSHFQLLFQMWYNPVTDPNGRVRHVLGAFFPLYASLSKENQDSISEVPT